MKYGINSLQHARKDTLLGVIALIAFSYALFIAVHYANQPLLEQYGFRQTQTALTSLWFVKDGFKLAYETPVTGAPWSIPFEFPIYQYLVALAFKTFGFGMDATGRIISFIFLTGCLFPARSICRQLSLPKGAFFIFSGLLFSSPVYIEWGRSFMMETAAVFFAVAAIKYFVDFLMLAKKTDALLFIFFIVLSILQKATTGLPVLAVMALLFLFHEMRKTGGFAKALTASNTLLAFLMFALPIVVGAAWAFYTDRVKLNNEFGAYITSSALSQWNWGTMSQRFSERLYMDVIWKRMLVHNLGGFLGLALIIGALYSNKHDRIKLIIGTALLLGLLPLYIFTNLHLIHLYYQSANAIFLIFALAVALASLFDSNRSPAILVGLFLALVASNYFAFARSYYSDITANISSSNNQELGVASALKNNINPNEAFVAFGSDWSSALSYYSERKSFTVPNWFKNYNNVLARPQSYLGGMPLGAVVVCPLAPRPNGRDLLDFSYDNKKFKLADAAGCYIALPEHTVDLNKRQTVANCEGDVDVVMKVEKIPQSLLVSGWTTVSGVENKLPESVFVTLTDSMGSTRYYDTVKISRPDVRDFFHRANLGPAGFSRIIDVKSLAGEYSVGFARAVEDRLEQCQFKTDIKLGQ